MPELTLPEKAVEFASDDSFAPADCSPRDSLFQEMYPLLRDLAAAELRRERTNHTYQPTDLLHEAFVKMRRGSQLFEPADPKRYLAAAVRIMRRVLVDHARRRNSAKRPTGQGRRQQPLEPTAGTLQLQEDLTLLALNRALEVLESCSQRQHDVVTLHFFGGFKFREIAEQLGVSLATVEREWRFARAWLCKFLDAEGLDTSFVL